MGARIAEGYRATDGGGMDDAGCAVFSSSFMERFECIRFMGVVKGTPSFDIDITAFDDDGLTSLKS